MDTRILRPLIGQREARKSESPKYRLWNLVAEALEAHKINSTFPVTEIMEAHKISSGKPVTVALKAQKLKSEKPITETLEP